MIVFVESHVWCTSLRIECRILSMELEDSKLVFLLVRFFVECVWSTTAWRTTKFMERHKFIKQKQMELLKLPLISSLVDSTTLSAGPLLRGSGCPVHRVSRVNPKGRFRDATWKSKRGGGGEFGNTYYPATTFEMLQSAVHGSPTVESCVTLVKSSFILCAYQADIRTVTLRPFWRMFLACLSSLSIADLSHRRLAISFISCSSNLIARLNLLRHGRHAKKSSARDVESNA